MEEFKFKIRKMKIEDYDQVFLLWKKIKGFAIRSVDDSREGVERFIRRNPTTSIVAEKDGIIIGSILCGHDGRRGCFYHVCVMEEYRQNGIGKDMVHYALKELQKEKISKVSLVAFTDNKIGNSFWMNMGWKYRTDLNNYDFVINQENMIHYND